MLLNANSTHSSLPTAADPDFEHVIAQTTSPEFERLEAKHRAIHRDCYTNVLMDELHQDSLSAVISLIKHRLHAAWSLPHTQLVRVIPVPEQRIEAPIVLNYRNGYIVIEWMQNKIYRHVPDDIPGDPWQKSAE